MPFARAIIPRSIIGFNQYLTQTCNHIILGSPVINAFRYNWTAADIDAWQKFLIDWTPQYLLYMDRKGGYTTDIKDELHKIIAEAVSYDKSHKLILKVKATVDLTITDCSIFNIPKSYANLVVLRSDSSKTNVANKTTITLEAVYPKKDRSRL